MNEHKSSKEVMQNAMFSCLVEVLGALRKENVDNALIREIKAIHDNTTIGDLPEVAKIALANSVDTAFYKLFDAGYSVVSK